MDGIGFLEALLDTAELAMNVDIDVVAKGHAFFSCRIGAPGSMAISGSNTGGQELVVDLEQAAGFFRRALGLGHDGGDPLADEADNIVEHVGVVGIHEMILMGRR